MKKQVVLIRNGFIALQNIPHEDQYTCACVNQLLKRKNIAHTSKIVEYVIFQWKCHIVPSNTLC